MTSRSPRYAARSSRASASGGEGGGPEPVAAEPGAARAAAGPSAARVTKARRVRLGIRYPPYLPLLSFGQEGRARRLSRTPARADQGPAMRPVDPRARRRQPRLDVLLAGRLRRRAHVPAGRFPRHRPRMPRPKSPAFTGTAELNAMIERVAPDILGLLADGTPRTKAAIAEALAGRHDKQD